MNSADHPPLNDDDITSLSLLRPGTLPRERYSAANVLEECADTYRERNQGYGENFRLVGPIMALLFPQGITAELLHSDRWHLFELVVVKLTRFANSSCTHIDSIHDAAVYSAMIEASLTEMAKAKEAKGG